MEKEKLLFCLWRPIFYRINCCLHLTLRLSLLAAFLKESGGLLLSQFGSPDPASLIKRLLTGQDLKEKHQHRDLQVPQEAVPWGNYAAGKQGCNFSKTLVARFPACNQSIGNYIEPMLGGCFCLSYFCFRQTGSVIERDLTDRDLLDILPLRGMWLLRDLWWIALPNKAGCVLPCTMPGFI